MSCGRAPPGMPEKLVPDFCSSRSRPKSLAGSCVIRQRSFHCVPFGRHWMLGSPPALWVPPGYGHAFVVLSDTARVYYDVTQEFHPQSERGILWNDPALGIEWPIKNPVLSPKDESWPVLADAAE